jgi:ferritin-like metal-binding protein YciE
VLPKLAHETKSESLARAFDEHLQETFGHVANVERVFALAGAEVSSNLDSPAERLFAQHDELAGSVVSEVLRDLFHASQAVAAEHHELAHYEALDALAGTLGLADARRLLDENRGQDEAALGQVSQALERLAKELA